MWFVDPESRYHTQGIERAWVDTETTLKRHRYPSSFLRSHLDEVARPNRNQNSNTSLLNCFRRDVQLLRDKPIGQ